MYRKEILRTINLAHFFKSAFTADQVYRYLPVAMPRAEFDGMIRRLESESLIVEKSGALFLQDVEECYRRKRRWSRDLFRSNRRYLSVIANTPWVKYVALTGANAFESCREKDDIDLFLVSRGNRLWLCYLVLVLFSKVSRKRSTLCLNYIVDENNLRIPQQDYYTAVQIMQMVPIFDTGLGRKLIDQNRWVFDHLPNAAPELPGDDFYTIRKRGQAFETNGHFAWMSRLNRYIYRRYARRLSEKYPEQYGSGIVLDEGRAKLNRVDHRDLYQRIMEEMKATLPL